MEDEIDLRQVLDLLWSKKTFIVIMIILACVIGYVYSHFMLKPKYTATSTMILAQKNASSDTSSTTVTQSDLTLNDKLIATYKELAKSNAVVREVIDNLNLDMQDDTLKGEINITAVTSTQILKVSVTDDNAKMATDITNELTTVFSKKIAELYKIDNISIVDKAEVPTSPSNVNHTKDIAIFACIGLVLSIGIIFLRNMLNNKIATAKDIENSTGLLVLAELPDCDFSGRR